MDQVLDVREHKADPKKMDISDLATGYLAAIEKVAAAVDEALDSDASAAGVTASHSQFEEEGMGKGLIALIVVMFCWWACWFSSGNT